MGKYIGFCVYRWSYLLWFPVIACSEKTIAILGYRQSSLAAKQEREMRKIDECDMEEFGRVNII